MSERTLRRPRHRTVATALAAFNGAFMQEAQCYFGGGTRIVLELDEYLGSEDLDFVGWPLEGRKGQTNVDQ